MAACSGRAATDGASTAPAVEDAGPHDAVDSGPSDTAPAADNGKPSNVYPAPHPAPPLVQSFGGATIHTPKIVTILWAGDTMQVNGEKLHLTITALRKGQHGGSEFIVTSTLGKQQNLWLGWVSN